MNAFCNEATYNTQQKIHVLPQTIIDHIGRNKTLDTSKTRAMY